MPFGITVKQKGASGFLKTLKYMDTISDILERKDLSKYGDMGVEALKNNTPVDTGKTADSWFYVISNNPVDKTYTINWYNSNMSKDWFPIAIYLQYGHATNNGGYVKGRDYINPALQPIFDKMAEDMWKEVTEA